MVPGGAELFTIDTPEDDPEWIVAVNKGIERKAKREAQHKYWADHPEEDPRIFAKPIADDKVDVCPMGPPQGILTYVDFTYESQIDKSKKSWFNELIANIKSSYNAWKFKRQLLKSPMVDITQKVAKQQLNFNIEPIKPEEIDEFKNNKN